jgi:hypothetical protein
MSAVISDMRDFIDVLQRAIPWGPHPTTDEAVHDYLAEMHRHIDDPAAVYALTGKICWRVVQQLEFNAEDNESVGDYCDAYRSRRRNDASRCRHTS